VRVMYVSVHSVLEYDEINMIKAAGHDVFALGANFGFVLAEPLREAIQFNQTEYNLYSQFIEMGGAFKYTPEPAENTVLPAEFVALFDVIIVMHDLGFIEKFWSVLSQRPVIWRTIGQNIDGCEPRAAALKGLGMHIVRYSPVERLASNYCGETSLIRFGKRSTDYGSGKIPAF